MDKSDVRFFNRLTRDFYAQESASFSHTRQAPWDGWHHLMDILGDELHAPVHLLDLACGNLRFESYLENSFSQNHAFSPGYTLAIDANSELVGMGSVSCDFLELDMSELLLTPGLLGEQISYSDYFGEGFDVSVCFGFMHHLPLFEQRRELLETMCACTRPAGFIAVSFWQFAQNADMLKKAREATERARKLYNMPALGEGDYLLSWQDKGDVFRYCHSFSEKEIDALVAALGASVQEVERFSADGRNGKLNRYLVLSREAS